MAHQSCIAHLLRRLNYLKEKYPLASWASDFHQLLCDALKIKQQEGFGTTTYTTQVAKILQRLKKLLEQPPDKQDKELYTFFKRILREQLHLFVFLYIEDLPPDNNASERAIRNIKVKQKISGQFKNEHTAQNFAIVRSVIDTTIKNGRNIWKTLIIIAENQFELSY